MSNLSSDNKPPKRSLLKKYDIPINHFDFDYVGSCTNVKELEGIVKILKSGEEGYYPDLTNCAEGRLKSLNPQSKALREEVPLITKNELNIMEWLDLTTSVTKWTTEMKRKDVNRRRLHEIDSDPLIENRPPIRKLPSNSKESKQTSLKNYERIRACDYEQWDKYDADTEIVKMDLKEEINREEVALKNKKNAEKPLIEMVEQPNAYNSLSDIERLELANRHRIKGNDFFKSQDYRLAIKEYTQSILLKRTAVAFNNRAMTFLKLGKNEEAISDCNDCLQLDVGNVKAFLRKGQALLNENKLNEAFGVYMKVIEIEPGNGIAIKNVSDIRQRIPDLPPSTAYRMKIQDEVTTADVNQPLSHTAKPSHKPGELIKTTKIKARECIAVDDDLAKLIIPKKMVTSKLSQMATTMNAASRKQAANHKTERVKRDENDKKTKTTPEIRIPNNGKIIEYSNGVIIEEL